MINHHKLLTVKLYLKYVYKKDEQMFKKGCCNNGLNVIDAHLPLGSQGCLFLGGGH